jgi:flagellar biosynthesis/type III secretory pathway chaperone
LIEEKIKKIELINKILMKLKLKSKKEADNLIAKFIKDYPEDFDREYRSEKEISVIKENEDIRQQYFSSFFKLSPPDQQKEINHIKKENSKLYKILTYEDECIFCESDTANIIFEKWNKLSPEKQAEELKKKEEQGDNYKMCWYDKSF